MPERWMVTAIVVALGAFAVILWWAGIAGIREGYSTHNWYPILAGGITVVLASMLTTALAIGIYQYVTHGGLNLIWLLGG